MIENGELYLATIGDSTVYVCALPKEPFCGSVREDSLVTQVIGFSEYGVIVSSEYSRVKDKIKEGSLRKTVVEESPTVIYEFLEIKGFFSVRKFAGKKVYTKDSKELDDLYDEYKLIVSKQQQVDINNFIIREFCSLSEITPDAFIEKYGLSGLCVMPFNFYNSTIYELLKNSGGRNLDSKRVQKLIVAVRYLCNALHNYCYAIDCVGSVQAKSVFLRMKMKAAELEGAMLAFK